MHRATPPTETNHNGSVTEQAQPVLYPVRFVYDAVIVNPGPEIQNQPMYMSPQPMMQWPPYNNQMQPQILPMTLIEGPRTRTLPPWLQNHYTPVAQIPRSHNINQQNYVMRTPQGNTVQIPAHMIQNNTVPAAYTTINMPTSHFSNNANRPVFHNQIRQNTPFQNRGVQSPQNLPLVHVNQTNQTGIIANNQRRAQENVPQNSLPAVPAARFTVPQNVRNTVPQNVRNTVPQIVRNTVPQNVRNIVPKNVRNAVPFAVPQSTQTIGKRYIRPSQSKQHYPNQAKLPILASSPMTNYSNPIQKQTKIATTQTGHNIVLHVPTTGTTNVDTKPVLNLTANTNTNYLQMALQNPQNGPNAMIAIPPVQENIIKLEKISPSDAAPLVKIQQILKEGENTLSKYNETGSFVNATAIQSNSSENVSENAPQSSGPMFTAVPDSRENMPQNENITTSVAKSQIEPKSIMKTNVVDKLSCDKKRKVSFQDDESNKKVKGLEKPHYEKITKYILEDISLYKKNSNTVENTLNVDRYKNPEVIIKEEPKQQTDSDVSQHHTRTEQRNEYSKDSQENSKIHNVASTKKTELNHVIDGIVIQESEIPFKQACDSEHTGKREEENNSPVSVHVNQENKTSTCNKTENQPEEEIVINVRPRFNILNHVIDGIVIQESDVPFAIRIPLKEKLPLVNKPAKHRMDFNNQFKNKNNITEDHELTENKETNIKINNDKVQKEQNITKNTTPNDKDERKKYVILENVDTKFPESNKIIRKANDLDESHNVTSSDNVKDVINGKIKKKEPGNNPIVCNSNVDSEDDEDAPSIGAIDPVDAKTLKSWTCRSLQKHLRATWCPCFDTLLQEEVDGRALFLVNERQLTDIGVHRAHARALCSFVRSSTD